MVALAVYSAVFFYVRALSGGTGAPPEPVPLAELFRTLAASNGRADVDLVASSLLLEMKQESETDAFESSKARLAVS